METLSRVSGPRYTDTTSSSPGIARCTLASKRLRITISIDTPRAGFVIDRSGKKARTGHAGRKMVAEGLAS